MLDPEDNSGVFTYLVGLIVLVMVAVGISLLMDKRFTFSSGIKEMRQEVELQGTELRDLSARYERESEQLAHATTKRRGFSNDHAQLTARLEGMSQQKDVLLEKKAALESSIASLDADFSRYRASYRSRTWSRAIGEDLGNLSVRGGREYKDSHITKVTDVGLEIRHEHGIARIQAPDLPDSFQDRFQWDDEERRLRLKEESDRLHRMSEHAAMAEDAKSGRTRPVRGAGNGLKEVSHHETREERVARREKTGLLRLQVKGWRTKVSTLSRERSEALQNSYGNATSVPGTLETWKARAVRLNKELTKARTELQIAKNKLAIISPTDMELEQEPEE